MRDDFAEDVKRALAQRVANRCCRPECGAVTSGPQTDPRKAVNVGVAAHITAASAGGPRHDPMLTSEQRQDIANGIWLCQTCAKLVDSDPARFTVELLREWKGQAESWTKANVGKTAPGDVGRGRLRIELPKPVNGIGYQGGAAFYPLWSVKIRLIAEGDRPLDIVELGVTEDGVGDWTIDEKFREGGAGRVSFPIRPRPSEEFSIRARSPRSFETKPTSFGRLTLWCRDHTQGEGERHEYVMDPPPVG